MTTAKGNVFVISAASGTGKTTLVSRLTAHNPNIRVSVSHTTRAPRENEQHGKHYYFTTREHFTELVGQGAFLEHAEVFGNLYGTSAAAVQEMCAQGLDVIFALEKAHPNNPLRQYWEKIKQDPLANPVHIKEPDRSHYKEIRELFVNPDVGLRRIQQHEKTQTHSFLQGKNEPTLAQRDLSAPARDGNSVMERLARLTEKNARLIEIYESGNEEAIRAANREIIENSPAVQKMIEGAKELATQEQQEQQAQQIAAMEMEAQQQSRGGRTR